jgi:hypothetical protein
VYNKATKSQIIFINGVEVAHCGGHAAFAGTGIVRMGQWAGARHWHGSIESAQIFPRILTAAEIRKAKLGTAASFDGRSRIRVDGFRNFPWVDRMSVSLFFHRTKNDHNYQGIVNNGYYSHGSFEVRMGRENGGTMMGGGVMTQGHPKAWDHVNLHATLNAWHRESSPASSSYSCTQWCYSIATSHCCSLCASHSHLSNCLSACRAHIYIRRRDGLHWREASFLCRWAAGAARCERSRAFAP